MVRICFPRSKFFPLRADPILKGSSVQETTIRLFLFIKVAEKHGGISIYPFTLNI